MFLFDQINESESESESALWNHTIWNKFLGNPKILLKSSMTARNLKWTPNYIEL